ncbi:macro domain-containing protein [Marivirga sp.]|uniref:macro domain-containing protein n=1 Tax=Marivirga sp. TaxID=2018662 RepID=UPI002D80C166|nr:macro domain-containing protein [Marivirga sp.]HET8860982.1 macro domain-containing protein [Marivirga sp.]
MKYFISSITSKAYWRYIFSQNGLKSILAIFGLIWLIIESLDFFNVYTRDQYASYAFFIFIAISTVISILLRRPIKSISVRFPEYDFCIEVRIANLFELNGATMISSNTIFEADVAGGKISVDSLQGQFTAKYYTGNQSKLISEINEELKLIDSTSPYPMGTTIPIHTHGKTFYLTAMAELGENGNASSTMTDVKNALEGLWDYVRTSGELQELAVPVVGTGRGRLKTSRKKMIAMIAESFVKASTNNKFTDKLIITIRPEDAESFGINLYDIKDHLRHILK